MLFYSVAESEVCCPFNISGSLLYKTSQGPLSSPSMCAGPCGGCSELYYDFFPERGTAGADLEDDSRQALCFPSCFMGCCANVASCSVMSAHDRVMSCLHVYSLPPWCREHSLISLSQAYILYNTIVECRTEVGCWHHYLARPIASYRCHNAKML